MPTEPLVSTSWLAEHLRDPNLRVVDIRGFVTTKPVAPGVEKASYRGAHEEYLAGHIPGASYVDWTTDITDPLDPVPAQVAPPDRFAEAMSVRGIGDGTTVIAVDHAGGQFATRLWWALRYYCHDDVAVLDGGWNRWVDEGHEIETGEVTQLRAEFTPRFARGCASRRRTLPECSSHQTARRCLSTRATRGNTPAPGGAGCVAVIFRGRSTFLANCSLRRRGVPAARRDSAANRRARFTP